MGTNSHTMGADVSTFPPELGLPEDPMTWNEKHLLKAAMWFFDHYDENDDNELNIDELGNLLAGAKGMIASQLTHTGNQFPDVDIGRLAEQMMNDLDADHSGTLDVCEFQDAFMLLMKHWLAAAHACTQLRDQMKPCFSNGVVLPHEFDDFLDRHSDSWNDGVDPMWKEYFGTSNSAIKAAYRERFLRNGADYAGFCDFLKSDAYMVLKDVAVPLGLRRAGSWKHQAQQHFADNGAGQAC